MRKILFTLLTLCCFLVPALAQADGTYYVVRHAEKMAGDDPLLTAKGLQRAVRISGILANVDIDGVYSTQTNRTLMTATVTAASKGVEVEVFSTEDLDGFAVMLKKLEGTYLIVAHSSSTPDLASLLSGEKIPKLDEADYEKLFKVTITGGVAVLDKMTTSIK